MSDPQNLDHKLEAETPATEEQEDQEILKTFDMYRFISRLDVILALLLILFLVALAFYFTMSGMALV